MPANHATSMEAGTLLRFQGLVPNSPLSSRPTLPRFFSFRVSSSSSSITNSNKSYRGPKPKRDRVAEWVSKNDDVVRTLPIYVGGFSLLAVLFNRAVSGIAPVADASRSSPSCFCVIFFFFLFILDCST